MKKYNCTVKLCDNTGLSLTEVNKTDMLATDMFMLIHKHGAENVVKIVEAGSVKDIRGKEERARLSLLYGEKHVLEVFGPAHSKLPTEIEIEEDDSELSSDDENEPEESEVESDEKESARRAKMNKKNPAVCNK